MGVSVGKPILIDPMYFGPVDPLMNYCRFWIFWYVFGMDTCLIVCSSHVPALVCSMIWKCSFIAVLMAV